MAEDTATGKHMQLLGTYMDICTIPGHLMVADILTAVCITVKIFYSATY